MADNELWVDADGPVSGAAMAASGITGAIRYIVAGSAGKLITAAEYADHQAHGRQDRFVVENLTTDADAGYNAGVTVARKVTAALAAIGAPAGSVVYAANDKSAWTQADVDYVRGFRDVLGLARTGAYGFGAFLAACHAQGVAGSLWQAGPAPSRTGTSAIANFWQRQGGAVQPSDGPTSPTTITLAGRVCDLNNRLNQEADDMSVTDPLPVARPDGSVPTVGEALGNLYIGAFFGGPSTGGTSEYAQLAAIAGGQAAIAAAVTNNAITKDEMQQMIDDAVAKHVQIAGTWTATGDQAATPSAAQ